MVFILVPIAIWGTVSGISAATTYFMGKRMMYKCLDDTERFKEHPAPGVLARGIRLKLYKIKKQRRLIREQFIKTRQLISARENGMVTGGYQFVHEVASEVVGRLGGRPTTSAGLKAARILAFRIMREKNHRHAHCDRDLPLILSLVQEPTLAEDAQNTIYSTTLLQERFDSRELTISASSLGLRTRQLQ
jgi:hypothetical protein